MDERPGKVKPESRELLLECRIPVPVALHYERVVPTQVPLGIAPVAQRMRNAETLADKPVAGKRDKEFRRRDLEAFRRPVDAFKARERTELEHILVPRVNPEFARNALDPGIYAGNVTIAELEGVIFHETFHVERLGTVFGPETRTPAQRNGSDRIGKCEVCLHQVHLAIRRKVYIVADTLHGKVFNVISERVQARTRNILDTHRNAHSLHREG